MYIRVLLAILILWRVFADEDQENFEVKYYSGLRESGVVKMNVIKKSYKRQPDFCYGALVDFNLAVVPCSCIAYTADESLMASAWNQGDHSNKLTMVESNTLMVGLMKDEYSPKEKTNQVAVIAVTIHPKCDATYQVDIGALILKKTPKGRRLTWVNSPYIHELESQFNGVASASVIHGQCYVLRWIETILDVNSHKAWTIIESSVYYQMWNMCLKLVCPEKMPDGKQFYRPKNFQECLNYGVIGQRKCMTMIPEQLPLCKYTPGSPVFCDVEQFHGIVGILTNFTSDCSFTRFSNGVMASFSDALKMDLIERHIRVRSSRYFSRLRVILANESKVPVTVPPWVKTTTTSP